MACLAAFKSRDFSLSPWTVHRAAKDAIGFPNKGLTLQDLQRKKGPHRRSPLVQILVFSAFFISILLSRSSLRRPVHVEFGTAANEFLAL